MIPVTITECWTWYLSLWEKGYLSLWVNDRLNICHFEWMANKIPGWPKQRKLVYQDHVTFLYSFLFCTEKAMLISLFICYNCMNRNHWISEWLTLYLSLWLNGSHDTCQYDWTADDRHYTCHYDWMAARNMIPVTMSEWHTGYLSQWLNGRHDTLSL